MSLPIGCSVTSILQESKNISIKQEKAPGSAGGLVVFYESFIEALSLIDDPASLRDDVHLHGLFPFFHAGAMEDQLFNVQTFLMYRLQKGREEDSVTGLTGLGLDDRNCGKPDNCDGYGGLTAMRQIVIMLKPASSACNLRCKYCFYADLAKKRDTFCFGSMSDDTVDHILASVRNDLRPGERVTFAFQGGEPTLVGLDWYAKFAEKARDFRPAYALQTNGTLLDETWAEFLRKK